MSKVIDDHWALMPSSYRISYVPPSFRPLAPSRSRRLHVLPVASQGRLVRFPLYAKPTLPPGKPDRLHKRFFSSVLSRKKKRKIVLLIDDEDKWLKEIAHTIAGLSVECEVISPLFFFFFAPFIVCSRRS